MSYWTGSVYYDDVNFDASANALEAGVESVPLYYAEAVGGFGEPPPPSINVQGGDKITTTGPLVWVLLGVVLYLIWR